VALGHPGDVAGIGPITRPRLVPLDGTSPPVDGMASALLDALAERYREVLPPAHFTVGVDGGVLTIRGKARTSAQPW
jgi:hypothetical protein